MPVIRKLLRVLAHRTHTHGRCYGQTAAGGCNAGQSDPRDGSAPDAYHERPVSDGLSPRAPDRAPTRVDPASPRAVLDGRDSARAGGVEPSIGRHGRPAGADVPAHRGDPRGVLSTLPGSVSTATQISPPTVTENSPPPRVHSVASAGRTRPALSLSLSR